MLETVVFEVEFLMAAIELDSGAGLEHRQARQLLGATPNRGPLELRGFVLCMC